RRLPAAQPRDDQANGCKVDAGLPAGDGCGPQRHACPLPRSEAPCLRSRAAARRRLCRAPDRQDGGFALQPLAATVDCGMKRLRVLVLMHPDLVPPESLEGRSEKEIFEWKTEYDVVSTLRAAGHDVKPLGVQDELKPIRYQIENWKPHIVFNL